MVQRPTKTVPGSSGGGGVSEVSGFLVVFVWGKLGQSGLFSVFLGDFGDMSGKTWMFLGLEKLLSPKSRWK